jgi:hypothetical protein
MLSINAAHCAFASETTTETAIRWSVKELKCEHDNEMPRFKDFTVQGFSVANPAFVAKVDVSLDEKSGTSHISAQRDR